MCYGNYSFINMSKELFENKTTEGYDGEEQNSSEMIEKLGKRTFMMLFFLNLLVWVWALLLVIFYWNSLKTWVKVAGVLGLLGLFGGPILTIVVVYISLYDNDNNVSKILNYESVSSPSPELPEFSFPMKNREKKYMLI